mmetsp:Transcript_31928/g.74752  ORF Transcript_31928/g.74752 Transcript_31928/m.74752 type:complete len:736 (+) Transcript_31928:114-2321(+)
MVQLPQLSIGAANACHQGGSRSHPAQAHFSARPSRLHRKLAEQEANYGTLSLSARGCQGSPEGAEEVALQKELKEHEAILRRLKQVIQAQHATIEALRAGGPKAMQPDKEVQISPEARKADLLAEVRLLKAQIKVARKENAERKKAVMRQVRLLRQLGVLPSDSPKEPTPASEPTAVTSGPTLLPVLPEQVHRAVTLGTARLAALPEPVHRAVSLDSPRMRVPSPSPSSRSSSKSLQDYSLQSRLAAQHEKRMEAWMTAAGAIWEPVAPSRVLIEMLKCASKVAGDSGRTAITVFIINEWMQTAMMEAIDEASEVSRAGVFYLSGKVTLHAYQLKVNPMSRAASLTSPKLNTPKFKDLASLPLLGTGSTVALPLQKAGKVHAVLQLVPQRPEPGPKPSFEVAGSDGDLSPKREVLARGGWSGKSSPALFPPDMSRIASPVPDGAYQAASYRLGPSQIAMLEALCHTTLGIVLARSRNEAGKVMQRRALHCIELASEMCSKGSLIDFEQRLKKLLQMFFSVSAVRIAFHDIKAGALLSTSLPGAPQQSTRSSPTAHGKARSKQPPDHAEDTKVGLRRILRTPVSEGVVGKCVGTLRVFKTERLADCQTLDELADGVRLSGALGGANMLAGPMVARWLSGNPIVMGTLQLIGKTSGGDRLHEEFDDPLDLARMPGGAGARVSRKAIPTAFTAEDEDFFNELLKMAGVASYQMLQVLSQVKKPNQEVQLDVARLLEAP